MNANSSINLKVKAQGLLTILYGLMPAILVASFLIVLLTIINDVRGLVTGPLENVQTALVEIKDVAQDLGDTAGTIVEPIQDINQRLADALSTLESIPTQLEIPSLNLPDVNLPVEPAVSIGEGFPPSVDVTMKNVSVQIPSIPSFSVDFPGLGEIAGVLTNNLNILGSLSNVLADLPGLDALRQESSKIVEASYTIFKMLKTVAIKVLVLTLLAALILIPLCIRVYISPYITWANKMLRKGWKLMHETS